MIDTRIGTSLISVSETVSAVEQNADGDCKDC